MFVSEFEVMGVDSGAAGGDTDKGDTSSEASGATSETSSTASSATSSTASSTASSAASSTASSATSNKPAAGDAGLLCFAVIAVVSIAGVAVAVKVRK